MAHYQTKHHGYNDDELISTLQKEVRRGNEEKAIYWALELGEEGKSGFGQLASRLRVISYEDIGLGDPNIVLQVSKAIDDMQEMYKKNKGEWRIVLSYIVLLLCRAKHSRITDHFIIAMKDYWKNKKLDIPDYALDMHTSAGNLIGRTKSSAKGIDHFTKEGEKLKNENPSVKDIYKEEAHQILRKREK